MSSPATVSEINPAPAAESIRHVSAGEMRALLRQIYQRNPEEKLAREIARHLLDPVEPYRDSEQGERKRPRIHPHLLALAGMALLAAATFFCFSFWR